MKTRLEVIEYAARKIGVLAEDESLTAAQVANIGATLDGIFAELSLEAAPAWDLTAVDDAAFVQLGNLLAADIAADYGVPPVTSRPSAWLRLMAQIRPDTRAIVEPEAY